MTACPEWFTFGEKYKGDIVVELREFVRSNFIKDVDFKVRVECACLHIMQCLEFANLANRKGYHAISISLLRQCVEASSVVELGLINDRELAKVLLAKWVKKDFRAGQIRQELAKRVWTKYGSGIWQESWEIFFGKFANAVQPYAHYTSMLQNWQFVNEGPGSSGADGHIYALASFGPQSYDAAKATRATLFELLIIYVLGRLLVNNGHGSKRLNEKVGRLGSAIGSASELGGGKIDWEHEFWGHEFTMQRH